VRDNLVQNHHLSKLMVVVLWVRWYPEC
jgi:hypothetical protein